MHKINFNEDLKMTDKTQRRYFVVLMWPEGELNLQTYGPDGLIATVSVVNGLIFMLMDFRE